LLDELLVMNVARIIGFAPMSLAHLQCVTYALTITRSTRPIKSDL
jgi:hypothetical protein